MREIYIIKFGYQSANECVLYLNNSKPEYDQSILITIVTACEKCCCQSWIWGSVSPSEEVAAYRHVEGKGNPRREE